jgi:hypothetical protein
VKGHHDDRDSEGTEGTVTVTLSQRLPGRAAAADSEGIFKL